MAYCYSIQNIYTLYDDEGDCGVVEASHIWYPIWEQRKSILKWLLLYSEFLFPIEKCIYHKIGYAFYI